MLERGITKHNRTFEHCCFVTERLQPVVRTNPDALLVEDLAFSSFCTATWTVSLILDVLRFGAQVGGIGQGTVATISTAEDGDFRGLFDHMSDTGDLFALVYLRADRLSYLEAQRTFDKCSVMNEFSEAVLQRYRYPRFCPGGFGFRRAVCLVLYVRTQARIFTLLVVV